MQKPERILRLSVYTETHQWVRSRKIGLLLAPLTAKLDVGDYSTGASSSLLITTPEDVPIGWFPRSMLYMVKNGVMAKPDQGGWVCEYRQKS